MLIRVAIISVSLAVMQAAIPTPRATSNPKGSSIAEKQSEAQTDKAPSNSVSVVCEQPASNTGKSDTSPKNDKDGWDKAAVLSNYLLVLAGGFGIFYAARTLGKIKTQADEMKLQRVAAQDTLEAIKSQLKEMQKVSEIENKTLVLQFRPKIIVRFASAIDFNLVELGKPSTAEVRLVIANTGGSPAHITRTDVSIWCASVSKSQYSEKIIFKQGEKRAIWEGTLQPGEKYRWEGTLPLDTQDDLQWANYHQGLPTEDHRSMILVGTIDYVDDLGIPRSTGIHRNFDPKTKTFKAVDTEGEYND